MSELLQQISEELQKGKAKVVVSLVQQALDAGVDAQTILEQGMLSGMDIIGARFTAGEIYVPEVLIAARAMNQGTAVLKPHLTEQGAKSPGKAVIGTVHGDLHDIGKNLVKMMLEGKGIEVIDLGVDVTAAQFVAAAKENGAELVCCSALLTTTMGEMRSVVEAFQAEGLRDKVTIMIGGAPVTEAYCQEIGADVYTPDAGSAAVAAKDALVQRHAG